MGRRLIGLALLAALIAAFVALIAATLKVNGLLDPPPPTSTVESR